MASWRIGVLGIALAVASGSVSAAPPKLVLLTRDGCANTATMRAHLDEALRSLHRPLDYQFIDQETLGQKDPRRGYPTPTLLVNDKDMFGLPVPMPPVPEPT